MSDPAETINRGHAVERTSPHGEPFVGRCFQCGKTLTLMQAALTECTNIAGFTVMEAITTALERDD